MKKELKEKVQLFFKDNPDISLVYKEFGGLVYRDTLKRWCFPEKAEEARIKSLNNHRKNKNNSEYKEKRRLQSKQYRQTEEYSRFQQEYYSKNKEKIQTNAQKHYKKHHPQPLWKRDNLSKGNRLTLELKFPLNKLNQEKDYYLHKEGNYDILPPNNRIVLNFQPHFYDQERILWSDVKVQQKLLNNRSHYLNKTEDQLSNAEILRGFKISGIHYGYSHFSPLWFKKFTKDYSIESVYDPCGGWGHRMVGLLGTSVKKYWYNDFDPRTVEGAKKIRGFLELNSVVEISNERAEKFIPDFSPQCIFTCPPYYNKETYNNRSFKNLEDFSSWWHLVVSNSLSLKPQYFAVVIDNEHQDIISKPFKNGSLILEQRLGKNQMHLSKSSSTRETLLVFKP